jgi:hypothetical protein
MWLLRRHLPDRTLYAIGRLGGYRSAAEARTAIAVVDALMARDGIVAAAIEALLPDLPPLGSSARPAPRPVSQNTWSGSRDHNMLRTMREAERDALPPRKQPGDRACLGCGKLFASKWCGNRLCTSCGDRT